MISKLTWAQAEREREKNAQKIHFNQRFVINDVLGLPGRESRADCVGLLQVAYLGVLTLGGNRKAQGAEKAACNLYLNTYTLSTFNSCGEKERGPKRLQERN